MLQPGLPKQYEAIVKGVQDGALDEANLNQNVKRILWESDTPDSPFQGI